MRKYNFRKTNVGTPTNKLLILIQTVADPGGFGDSNLPPPEMNSYFVTMSIESQLINKYLISKISV